MDKAKEGTLVNAVGQPKPRNYKLTPDQLIAQVNELPNKDLFLVKESIEKELEHRRAEANKLVEELKPQSTIR